MNLEWFGGTLKAEKVQETLSGLRGRLLESWVYQI